ncbi:response regulator [Anaerophaga thermohalophila]|uniref:response regulator n=1 Tax=Anaerophaga thermohalophila TaxID=177400 RepID=UPI0002EDCDE3|nr:response regulator [Anaerophaga thermohalophila]
MKTEQEDYILIIDDSETNNILLEALLEKAGYKTKSARSANEGWKLIHQELPKLILLDLLMPKISGFHMLSKLQSNEKYGNIPVIIVSALNEQDTINMLLKSGAVDFFSKPIDIHGIVDRVKEIVPID